jgi:hypothetical protein
MLTTNEFDRFLVLFDRLAEETNVRIERASPDKLDWLPIDNANMRFGDRISRTTIRNLYVRIAVAEHEAIRNLQSCAAAELLPVPRNPDLSEALASGDLIAGATRLHHQNMQTLRDFDAAALEQRVRFAADHSVWSVMGFLWGLYAHRAYHLGNIDLYLRQADAAAPDFYSFASRELA